MPVEYDGTNIPPDIVASLPAYEQAQIPFWNESLQPNMYASIAICAALALASVCLRLYSRRLKGQPFLGDDYIIVVALFFYCWKAALSIAATYLGAGRHQVVTVLNHPARVEECMKLSFAAAVLYMPTQLCSKFSILLLYHRIFSASYNQFRWVCLGVAVFVSAYSVAFLLTLLFQCFPVQGNWDPSARAHCVNISAALQATSAINVATDALVLALPVPLVWRMRTSLSRRVQVLCVFLLGSFIVVVSVFRTVYVRAPSPSRAGDDGLWVASYPMMWSTVETGLAIVAACLPVMRPVLDRLLRRPVEGSRGSSGQSPGNGMEPLGSRAGSGRPVAHLVTIGGRKLELKPRAPGPGGGAYAENTTTTYTPTLASG